MAVSLLSMEWSEPVGRKQASASHLEHHQAVEGMPVEGMPVEGRPVDGRPVDGRPGRGLCVRVWNRATFFSPDVAHSQRVGCFSPRFELLWLAPKCWTLNGKGFLFCGACCQVSAWQEPNWT